MRRSRLLNERGFSLIELMIVIGIVGILAAMAQSKLSSFNVQAKQAEVRTTLNHIYTLARIYKIDNSTFQTNPAKMPDALTTDTDEGDCNVSTYCQTSNPLGFAIGNCQDRRYDYTYGGLGETTFIIRATELSSDVAGTCTTVARKVNPDCGTRELWQMNQDKNLSKLWGC